MEKILMSGNEAIALGAYEAGVKVGAGYPGTPSTEILENLCRYPEVSTEWSVNEKVALEVGIGSALAGGRALITMKHVGLNVAADPLFTASYIGVKGGLVVVTADDPEMHSSQNEQDNRHYARAAKIPMLEPSDSEEARDFTKIAFEISEKYDTPVLLRTTTRISHSMSGLVKGQRVEAKTPEGFIPNQPKYVMIPLNAKKRHPVVERRMFQIAEDAENMEFNFIEGGTGDFGIITSGVSYTYVREAYPDVPVLKLGMVYPLPELMIREFCSKYSTVYVVEELDPFIEDQIKAWGLKVRGKDIFPIIGEYSPELIRCAIGGKSIPENISLSVKLPPRPPSLCPGCPHRIVYSVLSRMKLKVSGDIGCYSLGALPPFTAMHTCIDMGASITVAQGIEMAMGGDCCDTVALLGDSTFAHSGITGLLNAAYNKRHSLIIVLDNGTTAMTGIQPNPLSGETINGHETVALDYAKFGEACGLKTEDIRTVDAYKEEDIEKAISEMTASGRLSLLIVKGLCIILKRRQQAARKERGA
ncbi:MAG: hypothetical protein A2017_20025 [Lentisphaerae bacterium GWF2_44_16]|nr:MAG: hypothetical protein A2017_20025 [Lentisphaerae bacterium GWF2_44_16]